VTYFGHLMIEKAVTIWHRDVVWVTNRGMVNNPLWWE